MFPIVNNTVKIPLHTLSSDKRYASIKVEKRGYKYAYLNLEQYEDFLQEKPIDKLIRSIKQALFSDNKRILTQVSLMNIGYPYSVGGISKQDIIVAIKTINDKGLNKTIHYYYNSYGVLTIHI